MGVLTNVVLMGDVTVGSKLLVISMPTTSWMRSTVRVLHVTPKAHVMALVTHARTVAPCWIMTVSWLGTMSKTSLQSSSISERLIHTKSKVRQISFLPYSAKSGLSDTTFVV